MSKQPLIAIETDPLEVWYESPSVIIVNKPQGIPSHPENAEGTGTLLNRLFQHNRWLAHMETSHLSGVIHRFGEADHGLMVFTKDDKYQVGLEEAHRNGEIQFRYLVTAAGQLQNADYSNVETTSANLGLKVVNRIEVEGGQTLLNIAANTGDTMELKRALFPGNNDAEISFFSYEVALTLPHTGEPHRVSLRKESDHLPKITVFHAPP